jgi:hypothetical protein
MTMKINTIKLANAVKLQSRTLTMNDKQNKRLGTDFFHWAIVRKVRSSLRRPISLSDVVEWVEGRAA